ncbi:MAG: 4Fe-4S dicluster domain-containing protein [Candidatus Jordarchaeales archaeon]
MVVFRNSGLSRASGSFFSFDPSFAGGSSNKSGHIITELEKCTGCMLCMVACAVEHTGLLNPSRSRLRVENRLPVVEIRFLEECDLCRSLGTDVPVCVRKCPRGALKWGGKA